MPKLATKEYCTGCTACASVCPKGCISMKQGEDGFLYPEVAESKCVGCGLCEKTCPIIMPRENREAFPVAYAAYTKDEAVRMESSSGGVFTELARWVLARNGAVFGAAYDDAFEITHICVEDEASLAKLRGSKYAQSDLSGVFCDVNKRLQKGQQVLFSGTPCQVAGLKVFLRKEYENLLTVDFVCHSVPSPMAWKAYVEYRANRDNGGIAPECINLRSKQTGWSRYRYSNLFRYGDGHSYAAQSGDSLYMKLFGGGYINRLSCASCQFKGYSRVSDLTIGDFWGIWNMHPEMDDDRGTSLVLIQSDRGAAVWKDIEDRLIAKQVTLEEASRENPAMLRTSQPHPRREEALEMIASGKIGECEGWFLTPKTTLAQRIKRKIKNLLRRVIS